MIIIHYTYSSSLLDPKTLSSRSKHQRICTEREAFILSHTLPLSVAFDTRSIRTLMSAPIQAKDRKSSVSASADDYEMDLTASLMKSISSSILFMKKLAVLGSFIDPYTFFEDFIK